MREKIAKKLTATILIVTLMMANLVSLAQGVFAATEVNNTNNKDVKFESYWKQEKENKKITVGKPEEKQLLYIKIGVSQYGYLKEGTITLEGNNFKLEKENVDSNRISEVDTSNNTIKINRVKNGEEIELAIPVSFEKAKQIDLSYFGRETTVNLTAIYMDESGKEVEIAGKTSIQMNWETEAEIEIKQEVEKYLTLGENTILQTKLIWGVKENILPIEEGNIEITVPEIKGIKPSKVKVLGVKNIQEIGEDNWKYNKETGKISINVKNIVNAENKVKWEEEKEEYKIIYEYEKIGIEKTRIDLVSKLNTKIYTKEKEMQADERKTEEIAEQGSIVSGEISVLGDISKGYLYANNNYETSYEVKEKLEISDIEYAKEVEINHQTNFVMEEDKKVTAENSTYYEESKIKKTEIDKILGEKGSLEIVDNKGNVIIEIKKDTKEDKEGNIVVKYDKEVSKIVIKIHNAEKEGQIEIISKKKIKGQTGYNLEDMKQMKEIAEKQEIKIGDKKEEKEGKIALKETVSKAEISISTSNLSTVMKNENVEMRIVLNADNSKYDLWKNPVVEIELPKEIESIDIKGVSLAFSEEVKIEKCELIRNDAGNLVIRVITMGEQTEYVPEINRGIQIAIVGDITLDKKSASTTEQIKVKYTNDKQTTLENEGIATVEVNIYSPVGVIALNTIRNFNVMNSEVTSMGSMAQVGKLEILTEKKVATNQITAINNVGYTLTNPYILGRIAFAGNKKLTGEELGSNINIPMVSKIRAIGSKEENYTIYYSENGEATGDLNRKENGWVVEPQDLAKVKSYLIVWNSKEMKQAEEASFEYDIEIPEGLNYNKTAYSTYAMYYENRETRVEAENKIAQAPAVGISTGEGPELEVKLTASVRNGEEVAEGTRITYFIEVVNKGKTAAKNVKVTANIPEGTIYTEYYSGEDEGEYWTEYPDKKEFSFTKEEIRAGEKVNIEYTSIVKGRSVEDDDNIADNPDPDIEEPTISPIIGKEIVTKVIVTADNIEKAIETDEYKNKIKEGFYTFQLESNEVIPEGTILDPGVEMVLSGAIQNINSIGKNNLVITYVLPEELEFINAYLDDESQVNTATYDKTTRTVTWKIGYLDSEELRYASVVVRVKQATQQGAAKLISNFMTVVSKENPTPMETNRISFLVAQRGTISVTHTSNYSDGKLVEGDIIEYYIHIVNNCDYEVVLELTDYLPEGLSYQKTIKRVGKKAPIEKKSGEVVNIEIPAKEDAQITIVAKVNTLKGVTSKEIENVVKIVPVVKEGEEENINIDIPEINTVKHIIEKKEQIIGPDGGLTTTYKITGKAWLDENENGTRDVNEKGIEGIEVLLINADTGEIVTNMEEREPQRFETNKDGDYTFSKIPKGNYFIVFLYDTSRYSITTYAKEGVENSINSDVFGTQLNMDGQIVYGGITENIILEKNTGNMDIGLIETKNFDLSIDKTVTKMIVQNTKGTKEYLFEDSKLAKVDLDGKYLLSTNLIIEYRFKIKNEGKVVGYVKNVVDYLPKELQFKSELNKDWYLGKDGQIYNSSLENVAIQPGEVKEITLILTKKMTEDGTGVISNMTEIAEDFNEQGVTDIDSVPGNKKEGEDDFSSADVVIGIKTGKAFSYMVLILSSIIVIGAGIYYIRKKV